MSTSEPRTSELTCAFPPNPGQRATIRGQGNGWLARNWYRWCRRCCATATAGVAFTGLAMAVAADEPATRSPRAATPARGNDIWNAVLREFREGSDALDWSDHRVAHDWRIQRHSSGREWRLLDPDDRVVVAGSQQSCQDTFERLVATGVIPSVDGAAVLVLHGLGQSRRSMQPLVEHLRGKVDGTVMSVGYASPRASLDAHALALDAVIDALPETCSLSFVGHSLGNLVVRRWMATAQPSMLDRVQRMVMLGPPNQGSDLARLASKIWFLAVLSDGPARQLGLEWPQLAEKLAVPACEFGIVAGGTGDDRGMSLLLAGDDDAIVRVEETRLEGANGFLLLPVHHADMMRDQAVQRAAVCFLREGRFTEDRDAGAGGATEPGGVSDQAPHSQP